MTPWYEPPRYSLLMMPLYVWRRCVRLKSIGLHARLRASRRIYYRT